MIFASVELPAGASLDRTVRITSGLRERIKDIPGIAGVSMVNGFSLIGGAGSNYALGLIKLDPWEDREDETLSVDAITAKLFQTGAGLSDADILFLHHQVFQVLGFLQDLNFRFWISPVGVFRI